MFHNKLVSGGDIKDRITFLTPNTNYHNRIYNLIISNIPRHTQYDKYYVVNSDMLFFNSQMDVVIHRPYPEIMKEIVEDTINNHTVMKEIISGKALLIFDFGSEITPLSTDDTSIYGIINQHFKDIDCTKNVVYWTMYESPYKIVDKSKCDVDIVSASLSTLRYIGFNYYACKHMLDNKDVPTKSAMYLNRRIREHRTKLLLECLRRDVDLDDMHFSYIGNDEILSKNGEDISHVVDLVDLLQTNINGHQISRKNFIKVVNDLYKTQVAMEDKDVVKWLGSSKVGRVMELFNHRAKSKFEIITEYTYTDDNIQISEKLSLAILSKIPFVILGDKGYMTYLKKLGFKTFDKFWSEEYDTLSENDRIGSLTSTILDIHDNYTVAVDEFGNYQYSEEMNEILEYNYAHYKDVYAQVLYERILQSVRKSISEENRFDLKEKIWYNRLKKCVFVPIPGNNYEYFEEIISAEEDYKLVNRKDIPKLETLDAYVLIKTPVDRVKYMLYETSMTLDGFINKYKDTDRMLPQSSFIEGLNIKGIIDLENLGLSTEEAEGRDLSEVTELDRIKNWFFFRQGIEPSMMQQWNLSIEDEQKINDIFKGDITYELKRKF